MITVDPGYLWTYILVVFICGGIIGYLIGSTMDDY